MAASAAAAPANDAWSNDIAPPHRFWLFTEGRGVFELGWFYAMRPWLKANLPRGEGQPVLGLTWVPFVGQRFTSLPGGPVRNNGEVLAPLQPAELAASAAGVAVLTAPTSTSHSSASFFLCAPTM